MIVTFKITRLKVFAMVLVLVGAAMGTTKQGKLKESREEFRACLRYKPEPDTAEDALRAIAQINELIGVEHTLSETNRLEINRLEETN